MLGAGGHGAVYDRGYRPTTAAGPARAATFALYRASIRRALGLRRSWRQKVAPFVLLGIVTVPADRQRRHRLRHPRRDRQPHRVHHLPRIRRRVVGAAALRRPHRSRHHLPRPAPTGAAADVRPAADRRRLRARQGRGHLSILFAFSFLPQVVLFIGSMLVSDSALDYITDHLDVLWKVPVAVARAGRLLRRRRCRGGVAHQPPHRRRRQLHRPVPRDVDRVGDPRRRGLPPTRRLGRRADQRAGPPAAPRDDLDLPRSHRPRGCRSAASCATAALFARWSSTSRVLVARRRRDPAAPLPRGWSDEPEPPRRRCRRPPSPRRPASRRRRPGVRVDRRSRSRRVGVVRRRRSRCPS